MTDKMTDSEFKARCEWEGVDYAVTEYGLSVDHLYPNSPLIPFMEAVDTVKEQYHNAILDLEEALEEVEDEYDDNVH